MYAARVGSGFVFVLLIRIQWVFFRTCSQERQHQSFHPTGACARSRREAKIPTRKCQAILETSMLSVHAKVTFHQATRLTVRTAATSKTHPSSITTRSHLVSSGKCWPNSALPICSCRLSPCSHHMFHLRSQRPRMLEATLPSTTSACNPWHLRSSNSGLCRLIKAGCTFFCASSEAHIRFLQAKHCQARMSTAVSGS